MKSKVKLHQPHQKTFKDDFKDEKVFNLLLKEGILIGSRKWGGSTQLSDYDLVFDDEMAQRIKTFIGLSKEIKDAKYYSHRMKNVDNFKFTLRVNNEEKTINIISYSKNDLKVIEDLNDFMGKLDYNLLNLISKDKMARVNIVESFLTTAIKRNRKFF